MPQVHSHTKTLPDGRIVNVFKIWDLVHDKTPIRMKIADIQGATMSKRSGFSKIRYAQADTTHPLIVDEHNFLIDGRHRYFKLKENNQTEAEVRIVTAAELDQAVVGTKLIETTA